MNAFMFFNVAEDGVGQVCMCVCVCVMLGLRRQYNMYATERF